MMRNKWTRKCTRSPLSSVTNTDSPDSATSTSSEEFNLSREQLSSTNESGVLPHSSRNSPSSSGNGNGSKVLVRNSSVSSQSSLEGAPGSSPHRGFSPQIRAFGPDGRHQQHQYESPSSSYPPNRSSRSPSPARAASLDARYGNSTGCSGNVLPLQSSSTSLTTGLSSSNTNCSIGNVQGGSRPSRCLSPLLIPPIRNPMSEGSPAPPASPLGVIQPDLYQRRDGPVMLNIRRTGKCLGRLHLRLMYDFDKSDLNVHLIRANDLVGTDQGGFSDPYVKLNLSPEVDTRKRQTPILPNDTNPCFDQHFKFPVSYDELQDKTLVFQIIDYDRFSRNDIVGMLRIAMENLDLVSASPVEILGEISRERKPPEDIQEVLLSLSYLPSAERLTIVMQEARNLFLPEDKDTLDAFAKVSLLCGDKRVKKKKTAIRKATRCPVWNEAMSFNIPASSLATSAIEVCVMDSSSELMGGNAIVGTCVVGPATGSSGLDNVSGCQSREHWLNMTQSPRKAIDMWHTLH